MAVFFTSDRTVSTIWRESRPIVYFGNAFSENFLQKQSNRCSEQAEVARLPSDRLKIRSWQRRWKMDTRTAARRLSECVEKDPARLGGAPVFRGTRVAVKSLFDHLSAGDSVETFLSDFPGVTREQIHTVLEAAGVYLLDEVQGQ